MKPSDQDGQSPMTTRSLDRLGQRENSAGAARVAQYSLLLAAAVARMGHYDEAEQLLMELDQDERLRPAVLDLRAKMYAQQGRYAEAEACWLQALSLVPGNRHYRKALDVLVRERRRPTWVGRVAWAILAAIVFAALLLVFNDRLRTPTKGPIPEGTHIAQSREKPGQVTSPGGTREGVNPPGQSAAPGPASPGVALKVSDATSVPQGPSAEASPSSEAEPALPEPTPTITQSVEPPATAPDPFAGIAVQGIVRFDPSTPQVLINGQLLTVGQFLGGVEVLEIGGDSVRLRHDKAERIIKLK